MSERKILHYEIENVNEDDGRSFISYGSMSLVDGELDWHSDDTDSLFGGMAHQHGHYVLETIAEWARGYKTHSEECVYRFYVDGYKGDVQYVGFRYRIENEVPVCATALRSLMNCYLHTVTDVDALKSMVKLIGLDVKYEGDFIVFPKNMELMNEWRKYESYRSIR